MAASAEPVCQVLDTRANRAARAVRSALLLLLALAAVVSASLLVYAHNTLPTVAFLLATLSLLAATAMSVHQPTTRGLLLVQGAAVVSFAMLFWADSASHSGTTLSVSLAGVMYQPVPLLAGCLFATMVLAHLARCSTAAHACHCSA